MKILLLGHKGYLGSYLYENLKDVGILSKRNVYDNNKKYDYIINCIGKANLEYCEQNKEETDYSNRDVLFDIINYYPNSKIINFSSYYVYNQEELCDENSNTTRKYNYCRQKLEGEEIVNENKGVSFRVGKLFGNKNIEKLNKIEKSFDNYGKFLMNTNKLNNIVGLTYWKKDIDNYLKELKLIDNKTRYRKTNKIII